MMTPTGAPNFLFLLAILSLVIGLIVNINLLVWISIVLFIVHCWRVVKNRARIFQSENNASSHHGLQGFPGGMNIERVLPPRERFIHCFYESLDLKNSGLLFSSLEKRREATLIAHMNNLSDLLLIGKANEAVLLGVHIGDGLSAYVIAEELLNNTDNFYAACERWHIDTGLELFEDILKITNLWASSFDKYMEYCQLYSKFYPNKITQQNLRQFGESYKKLPGWHAYHIAMTGVYYDGAIPDNDAGKFAWAMGILQCVLDRSLAEKVEYSLMDETVIEHYLDDYLFISSQYFYSILEKYQAVHGIATNPCDHRELSILLDEPIRIWLEFMPEMKKADYEKYTNYFQLYWSNLAMLHAQDKINALAEYFPEAFTLCEKCSIKIPRKSPICRYCGKTRSPEGLTKEKLDFLQKVKKDNPFF